MLKEGIAEWS